MVKQGNSTAVPRLRFPEFRNAEAWKEKKLGELIETVSPPSKLPSSSYLATGKFPIVDQSQDAICGWTDDAQALVEEPLPLIVFGDHTCAIKLVEMPFAQGADGIKILAAKPVVAIEYLFHSLNHQPLVMEDYKRHFSVLKERRVFFPSVESGEQQKIADCLTSLDEVIAAQGRIVAALKAHKRGLMQQLFPREGETRPRLRFPEFRDAPEWNFALLRDLEGKKLVVLGRGNVISHDDMRANPGPNPVYSSSVINQGLMGTYGHHMFDEELISWSVDGGGHFFHRPKHKFSVTNVSGFMRVLSSDIVCAFLAYQLQRLHASQKFDYQQKAHPSVIRVLYRVGLPDPKEQQRIADCLSSLDDQIAVQSHQLAALKTHKQGLMQQLFPAPGQAP